MSDDEKIRSFGDMVDAVERLVKPIQEENERLHQQLREQREKYHRQLIVAIVAPIAVLALFIWFAYMAPDTSVQVQDGETNQQTQIAGTDTTNSTDAVMRGLFNGETSANP